MKRILISSLILAILIIFALIYGTSLKTSEYKNKIVTITEVKALNVPSGESSKGEVKTTAVQTELDASATKDLVSFKGIQYKKELGQQLSTPIILKNELQCGGDCSLFLKVSLSAGTEEYFVAYDDGPSGDPTFKLFSKDNNTYKYIGSTPTGLIMSGNGFLYTSSLSNQFHTGFRKFKIAENKIVESKQPFLYVGMKSKALSQLELKNNDGEVIARVTAQTPIDILLSDASRQKARFLIKTSFGIVGWYELATIPQCEAQTSVGLDGICYHGD